MGEGEDKKGPKAYIAQFYHQCRKKPRHSNDSGNKKPAIFCSLLHFSLPTETLSWDCQPRGRAQLLQPPPLGHRRGLSGLKGAQSPFLRSIREWCRENVFLERESLSRKRPELLRDPQWDFGDEVPRRRTVEDSSLYMHHLPRLSRRASSNPWSSNTCTADNAGIPQLLIEGGTKALWSPFSSTAPLIWFYHSPDRLKVQKRQLNCATLSSQLRMFKAGISSHQFLFQLKRLNAKVKSNRQKQFHLKWIGKPSVSTLLSLSIICWTHQEAVRAFQGLSQSRTASF